MRVNSLLTEVEALGNGFLVENLKVKGKTIYLLFIFDNEWKRWVIHYQVEALGNLIVALRDVVNLQKCCVQSALENSMLSRSGSAAEFIT